MQQIDEVAGIPVYLDEELRQVFFQAGLAIDADGSPWTYAPPHSGLVTLDDLRNGQDAKGRPVGYATDETGKPYIQASALGHPAPGYYVSTTSLQFPSFGKGDPRRYVDSELFPFIVLPGGHFSKWGIKLGAACTVENRESGRVEDCIFADIGPGNHLGEASIRLARMHGVNADARHGGESRRIFEYRLNLGDLTGS